MPHRRRLQAGQRLRALVVEDSTLLRHLVVRTLQQDPSVEVVASAPNGIVALDQMAGLNPDVVSLDIEMPGMDGLETLKRIRRDFPETRVVMFSSYTERGAAATLEALSLGADDYLTKSGFDESACTLRERLLPKIKQFFQFPEDGPQGQIPPSRPVPFSVAPKAILIGVSTGGPEALGQLVPRIPADFPLPILIVQHMPALFTRLLCERLAESSKLPIREAAHGERLDGPKVLVAPGDFHMRVAPVGPSHVLEIGLDQQPPQNSCRPAVDALFRSAADALGAATLAIVLTGMGQDGLLGARAVKNSGGFVIAQDQSTSAVWGMPRAVSEAGLADLVLPLPQIAPHLLDLVAAAAFKNSRKADF